MTKIDQAPEKGNGPAIVQHSSASNEHYTPRSIIEVCREVMGSIELDPASCELANRENVRAKRFFTKEDDGLERDWDARTIFVNPPGGKLRRVGDRWVPVPKGAGTSSAQVWWNKAVTEWLLDRSKTLCFLGFTLELLRLSQFVNGKTTSSWPATKFPFCVLRERTDFMTEGAPSILVQQGDPTHANVLVCITNSAEIGDLFQNVAERLGAVVVPRRSWDLPGAP